MTAGVRTGKGLFPFYRNSVRVTASVRTGKTEIHFSFLARKEKPISIRKRKEAQRGQVPPLETPEVSEVEAQQFSGRVDQRKACTS
ncbi:MAG: hypothetical protein RR372_07350, partial [Oscillospiraceae bacterium]